MSRKEDFSYFITDFSQKEIFMSATTTTPNGRPQRKQLSEQLDRLDSIIDVLGEGLNEAVIDAVREGTRLAIKDAIVEILTDTTLRTKLHQASAPEPDPGETNLPQKPSIWNRLKNTLTHVVCKVPRVVTQPFRSLIQTGQETIQILRSLGNLRLLVFIGLLGMLTIGSITQFVPPPISTIVSGIAGGISAMAVQVGIWAKNAFSSLKWV
jgi:hypothetical protein